MKIRLRMSPEYWHGSESTASWILEISFDNDLHPCEWAHEDHPESHDLAPNKDGTPNKDGILKIIYTMGEGKEKKIDFYYSCWIGLEEDIGWLKSQLVKHLL